MRTSFLSIILLLALVSCDSGNKPNIPDMSDVVQSGDEALLEVDVEEVIEEVTEETGEEDYVSFPDSTLAFDDSFFEEGIESFGSDVEFEEEVTIYLDDGFSDTAQPNDLGPQYSESVQACIYVLEGICDKFLKRCDEMALDVIPDSWLDSCTAFLQNQHALFEEACLLIDNANTNDPTIELIKTMGPLALRACVDNFQCTLDSVMALYDFLKPIFEGQKPDTSTILLFVTRICFPSR